MKSLLQTRTAGDPNDETIVFTDLSPRTLSETFDAMRTPVSHETIRQWMNDQKLRLRKISKVIPGSSSPDRDAQFVRIAELIDEYQSVGNPYFSVDTKAKERLGKLYRAGRVRCSEPFRAFDHA